MSRRKTALPTIAALLALGLPAPRDARADAVVLKSGRRIEGENVREENGQVVLVLSGGASSMSFKKELVARVERALAAAPATPTAPPAAPSATPAPTPKSVARRGFAEIHAPVGSAPRTPPSAEGGLDGGVLAGPARESPVVKAHLTAAYLAAIQHEKAAGRVSEALDLARRGVLELGEVSLVVAQADLEMTLERYREARETLRRAEAAPSPNAVVLRAVGAAEYALNHLPEAIRAFEESLRLSPDRDVEEWLAKARREVAAEGDAVELATRNLRLRYEGRRVDGAFSRALLALLESQYQDLARDFDVTPTEPITVILYTNEAFRDVTKAPTWSAGVYDGKVRLPLDGLGGVTDALREVTKHELTHSFVHTRSRGRAPAWLQEGLAQYEQGRRIGYGNARLLLDRRAREGDFDVKSLEAGFGGLGRASAAHGYLVSLAITEMLVARHGLFEVARVLDRLAAGERMADGLRLQFRTSYEELEGELADFLAAKTTRPRG